MDQVRQQIAVANAQELLTVSSAALRWCRDNIAHNLYDTHRIGWCVGLMMLC